MYLKDEIDFIKAYLSIEKARFGSRLKLIHKWQEKNIENWKIPDMLNEIIDKMNL